MVTFDVGRSLRVRVSFTDDAGNEGSLISHTVAVQSPPLTAEFRNMPERHTGEDAFTVRVKQCSSGVLCGCGACDGKPGTVHSRCG